MTVTAIKSAVTSGWKFGITVGTAVVGGAVEAGGARVVEVGVEVVVSFCAVTRVLLGATTTHHAITMACTAMNALGDMRNADL